MKFVGSDQWIDSGNAQNLPGKKVPDMFLEAVEAPETEMNYTSFDNFS